MSGDDSDAPEGRAERDARNVSVNHATRDDRTNAAPFGTVALDAPVTREDFERAVRALHLGDLELRDLVLRLAAQVVALTEELGRPLPPSDEALARIRAADARDRAGVWLDTALEDKYEAVNAAPPCAELMPICQARCCKLAFALSTADLDEGVIRWDYGQPYLIRQRASDGYCVHNDPSSHGCTVHEHRPGVCRRYDCRDDARVWLDYAARIPAPMEALVDSRATSSDGGATFDLMERAQRRTAAEAIESNALAYTFPDEEPHRGPTVVPRTRKPRV